MALFPAVSIKPNKVKKVSEFLLLKTIDGGDKTFINSAFISSKPLSSRLLFKLNSVFLKLSIYWAVFLLNCWPNCSLNQFFDLSHSFLVCLNK